MSAKPKDMSSFFLEHLDSIDIDYKGNKTGVAPLNCTGTDQFTEVITMFPVDTVLPDFTCGGVTISNAKVTSCRLSLNYESDNPNTNLDFMVNLYFTTVVS